jgi:nucleotide-binding universal stress UspA family protein
MFKHILISTDGSPVSNKAAKAGVALASALGAKVTAYYTVEQLQPVYADEGYMMNQKMIEGIEDSARQAGQKRVDAIGKMAKAAGVPFASVVTKALIPYEGIIAAAKKRRCDVIFMASHGRRGLSRLIMGSVTQKVLTHSRIPVVVYR